MDFIRNRGLFSDSLLNLGGHVIPMLVALVSLPVILSFYSLEQFGLLSLCWSLLGSFAYLDLGLGRATVKFIARLIVEEEFGKIRGVVWGSLLANGTVGIIGSVVVLLGSSFLVSQVLNVAPHLSDEASVVFSITGFAIPLITATAVLRGLLEAMQRFDVVNVIKAPSNALVFIIPLAGALLFWSLPMVVLLTVLSRFVTLLAYAMAALRYAGEAVSVNGISFSGFREVLKFGGWITFSNVLTPVIAFSDRLILAALVPLEFVAFYTAPYELISRLPVIPASVAQALFPIVSRGGISDRGTDVPNLLIRVVKMLLIVMTPVTILVIAFSGEGLAIWLGNTWRNQSTIVLQLLAVGFFFHSFSYIYITAVQGSGRADLKAKLDVVLAGLTVALCWGLVTLFGHEGAAVTKLVLFAADVSCLVVFTKSISGLSWGGVMPLELRRSIVWCLMAIAAAWALNAVIEDTGIRISAVMLLLAGLLWVLWRSIVLANDRMLIISLINRISARYTR